MSVSGLSLLDADGPQGARLGGVPRPHKGMDTEHARQKLLKECFKFLFLVCQIN